MGGNNFPPFFGILEKKNEIILVIKFCLLGGALFSPDSSENAGHSQNRFAPRPSTSCLILTIMKMMGLRIKIMKMKRRMRMNMRMIEEEDDKG